MAPPPRRLVTWYGLPALIRQADDGLCDIAVAGLALPHPSLVNRIIRRGVPVDVRARLSLLHEFGHVQTMPFLAIPAAFLWRRRRQGPLAAPIQLLALGAYWEMASEGYVVLRAWQEYVAALRRSRTIWPVLFWPIMLLLGMLHLLRAGREGPGGDAGW